ncbi:Protein required for attachment to host cells [[Luteovulum] sphaeroides subsp. megalophilum]|uniref:host attachment protein n=1 Tax=Cereibacter sphaeroides TaxID=1063 RepID=UPI000B67A5AB|nr:host attachment protein [Cereibacter sphaeroides]SNT42991.1 Protein required for attachment to host cells [[Luteovulum] sphaeroides subsp. megalophilum]
MIRLKGCWVLVLDATRARILRNVEGPTMLSELVLRTPARKLRDIMADKPGRSFSSMGWGRRSAMDYGSDPLLEDEQEFLRQVIALLDCHRKAGEILQLAIFAEHRVLGLLRPMLPPALERLVLHEAALNLLQLPPQDLARTVVSEINNAKPP